jgi:DNA processing protein
MSAVNSACASPAFVGVLTAPALAAVPSAIPSVLVDGVSSLGAASTVGVVHRPDTQTEAQLCAAALSELPRMTTVRLRALLCRWSSLEALRAVRDRDPELLEVLDGCRDVGSDLDRWQYGAKRVSLTAISARYQRAGVSIWIHPGEAETGALQGLDPLWPRVLAERFADDEESPPVLFTRGDLGALERPRVAIVGTRDPTNVGRAFASQLSVDLAVHGISVVSGLALGIDTFAHTGALRHQGSKPIAVVGTGLDVVYPRSAQQLWERVAQGGLLLSERPLGSPPLPMAFPARNRIIAQLAQVLVVVESRAKGGSLITAERAFDRGRPVLAVPGSPLIEQSAGTNALLRGAVGEQRAAACLDVGDVLALLQLQRVEQQSFQELRQTPTAEALSLLAAMDFGGWNVGRLAQVTRRSLIEVTSHLLELERSGWVERVEGRWQRKVGNL